MCQGSAKAIPGRDAEPKSHRRRSLALSAVVPLGRRERQAARSTQAVRTSVALFAACLTLPDSAWGCGACDEDRMAVTYDQSIVDKALDQHHLVAFCEVEGLQAATEQLLAELRNVDRKSTRLNSST